MSKKRTISLLSVTLILALAAGMSAAQGAQPLATRSGADEASPQAPVGTGFTYQGRLTDGGGPVNGTCDFVFELYDEAGPGGTLLGMETKPGVPLHDGLFTVLLDFGGAFWGEARWLEIEVDCGSGAAILSPRQPVTPAPYALALPGLLTLENPTSPSVVGGWWGNGVASEAVGATISGGGQEGYPNTVLANFGTVGGGDDNRVNSRFATIGGGGSNDASGLVATIGGGALNTTDGEAATVGGGWGNEASGAYATVPGGKFAVASHHGELAYASGLFTDRGDAQMSTYVLRGTTTDSSWHELFLDGSGERITIPPNRAMVVYALIVGRSDGGETAGYRIWGVIENDGGATKWVGAWGDPIGEDDPAWDAHLVANGVDDALSVEGLGNGETIRWVAVVQTVEVAW